MAGIPGKSGRKADPEAARRLRADDPQRLIKWIDLPESNDKPIPPMPLCPWFMSQGKDKSEAAEWSVRAIELWNTLWHSPQSTMWQADLHPMLDRYIILSERMWTEGDFGSSLLTQLATIEDKIGLSPKSMKDLYWRVKPNYESEVHLASVDKITGKRERLTDY